MKRTSLVFLFLIASTLVACDKDEPTKKEMVNACLFDPTGNCQKQAAAMAQKNAPAILPYINAGAGNQGGLANASAGQVKLFSVNDQALRDKAMKVQAAIEADNQNPNSLHYDPPQSFVPKASAADVAAAKSLPTQNDQVGLPVISSSSGGDAVR